MGLLILTRLAKKGLMENVTFEKRSEEGELGVGQVQNFRGKMSDNIWMLLDATISTQTWSKSNFKLNTQNFFSPGFVISRNPHTPSCSSKKLSPFLFSLLIKICQEVLFLPLNYSSSPSLDFHYEYPPPPSSLAFIMWMPPYRSFCVHSWITLKSVTKQAVLCQSST